MTLDRGAWIEAANALLRDVGVRLSPLGVELDPRLSVVADAHPCPGYVHDELRIGFCPPVIENGVDRLRWMLFLRYMGCASLEEAASFYEVALPLVVAHEVTHHLRATRGIASSSWFVEEQACDEVAFALVESMSGHRDTLGPLRERCRVMRARLGETHRGSVSRHFVPGVGDVLVASQALPQATLDELEALGAREGLDVEGLLGLLPSLSVDDLLLARAARAAAQRRMDAHYTRDPAEYWFLSLTWVESYLSRHRRELVVAVNAHVLREETAPDAARNEQLAALRAVLSAPGVVDADPRYEAALRAAAASELLGLVGHAALPEILETAGASESSTRTAIVEVLVRDWPEGAAADALAPLLPAPARAVALGEDPTPWLEDPMTRRVTLEALDSLGRTCPTSAWPCGTISPEERDAWVRVAARGAMPGFEATSLAVAVLCDASAEHAWDAADSVLASSWARELAERLVEALPPRGAAPWLRLRGLCERRPDVIEAIVRVGGADPRTELRRGALLHDLGAGPAPIDAARSMLHLGRALLGLGAKAPSAPERDLLAAFIARDARRVALDVVRATVPDGHLGRITRLCELAEQGGALTPVMSELLLGACTPELRGPIAELLAASSERSPDDESAALAAMSPMTRELWEGRTMPTLVEKMIRLRALPLFSGLEPEQLSQLAALSAIEHREAGEIVFREGEPGDALFVVISGVVSVHKDRLEVASLGPGSCFGEMAIFDGAPRSATARVASPAELLTLSGAALARAGRAHPALYETLLRVLSRRLREATDRLR